MKHTKRVNSMHHKIETTYNKLTPLLKKHYHNSIDEHDRNLLIGEAESAASYHDGSNIIVSLFHYDDFSVTYLCNNAHEAFNCFPLTDKKALFLGLEDEQLKFPQDAFNWLSEFTNGFRSIEAKNDVTFIYHCGLKLKSKDGESRHYFVRQKILTRNEAGLPISCIAYLIDVSHFLKTKKDSDDFYWCRMVRGHHKEVKCFRSSKKGTQHKMGNSFRDMVSDRELEILKMISNHKESKEIASKLNISTNTVDRHRKNMLARTRAKDTTALVQLCKMAGLF